MNNYHQNTEPCLVIMPFGKTPGEQLNSNLIYEHIIRPAFQQAGVPEHRIDSAQLLKPIVPEVEACLRNAPLVLADISGNNPNVLFELGFRKAQGLPFVCISNTIADATFYTQIYQIIDYTEKNAALRIAEAIKSAITNFTSGLSIKQELDIISERTREYIFDNPFQDRIAAWRIRRAAEQIESIRKGEWELDAKIPAKYVAFMFEGILQQLKEGEEYWTVTNLNFWSSRAIGDSAFLTANIDAARRGVAIKRVFLIDRKDIKPKSVSGGAVFRMLIEHKHACQKVNETNPGKMIVKCLISDELDIDLERYGHFALARDTAGEVGMEKGCIVIVPRYDPSVLNGKISHLKLIFSRGSSIADRNTSDYVEKFTRVFSEAQDLDALLEHIDSA